MRTPAFLLWSTKNVCPELVERCLNGGGDWVLHLHVPQCDLQRVLCKSDSKRCNVTIGRLFAMPINKKTEVTRCEQVNIHCSGQPRSSLFVRTYQGNVPHSIVLEPSHTTLEVVVMWLHNRALCYFAGMRGNHTAAHASGTLCDRGVALLALAATSDSFLESPFTKLEIERLGTDTCGWDGFYVACMKNRAHAA